MVIIAESFFTLFASQSQDNENTKKVLTIDGPYKLIIEVIISQQIA